MKQDVLTMCSMVDHDNLTVFLSYYLVALHATGPLLKGDMFGIESLESAIAFPIF